MFMLLRVEIHPGLLLGGGFMRYSHPTAAIRSRGGLDEYQSRARDRRPLGDWNEFERSRQGGGPRLQALAIMTWGVAPTDETGGGEGYGSGA